MFDVHSMSHIVFSAFLTVHVIFLPLSLQSPPLLPHRAVFAAPAAAKGAYLDDGSALPLTMAMVLGIEVSLPLFQLHDVRSHRDSRVEPKQETQVLSLSLKRAILKSKNLQFVPSILLMRVRVCFVQTVAVGGFFFVVVGGFWGGVSCRFFLWLALNKRYEAMGILGVFVVFVFGLVFSYSLKKDQGK